MAQIRWALEINMKWAGSGHILSLLGHLDLSVTVAGSLGDLGPYASRTALLVLLLVASVPSSKTCLVSSSVNGSSITCHPPAEPPHHLPANTIYLAVEFFNLTQLPVDALQGASNLQELHLSNNRLQNLSAEFLLPVPQLQVLDLTHNALSHLPPGLFQASATLHTLSLKENHLEVLKPSWLSGLKALSYLDLSGNCLSTLPSGLMANLTALQTLNLGDNRLEVLPPDFLRGPRRLERLHLENNQLQVLGADLLSPQPGLRYLFVQNNSLATVAAGAFRGLQELDMLDLSDNLLSSVPTGLWASLGQPTRAMKEGFDLSGNPWVCDANLDDLYHWMVANNDTMFSRKNTLCAGPEAMKGRALLEVAGSR